MRIKYLGDNKIALTYLRKERPTNKRKNQRTELREKAKKRDTISDIPLILLKQNVYPIITEETLLTLNSSEFTVSTGMLDSFSIRN